MKAAIVSFSRAGTETAKRIQNVLQDRGIEAERAVKTRYEEEVPEALDLPLKEWTGLRFADSDAVVFVGACGIAVRTIAPFIRSKQCDPAVLVVDEQGKFVISLLSGHLGGANRLTEELSRAISAVPVITTATDLNGKFAVDVFAKENGCTIEDMTMAKEISAALIHGEEVGFFSDFSCTGDLPVELCDRESSSSSLGICVTVNPKSSPFPRTLRLIPKVITVGIGCKKNTPKEAIEKAVNHAADRFSLSPKAFFQVASIDLKKEEPGLIAFCEGSGLPLRTFSSKELLAVKGEFSDSPFVKEVTGVSNVCERSAVLASSTEGLPGKLLVKKYAESGVTVALAEREWSCKF